MTPLLSQERPPTPIGTHGAGVREAPRGSFPSGVRGGGGGAEGSMCALGTETSFTTKRRAWWIDSTLWVLFPGDLR